MKETRPRTNKTSESLQIVRFQGSKHNNYLQRDFLVIPCRYSLLIRSYGVVCNVTSYISWLVSLMLTVQDAVAVEGVAVGASSPSKMSQGHYLVKMMKLGPVRTYKEMILPLDLGTKVKMVICYIPSRISWHYVLVPPMEMMHVRSGSRKSKWCCWSPPILMQY